jgi:hypothetical protein
MVNLTYHPPLGVRWLTFRLRNGQSIGPEKLRAVWSDAAETNNCSVRREHVEGAGFVYALYAPSGLCVPRRAELRMRLLLEEAGYAFSMGVLTGSHPAYG